jgi:uncharacterized protein YjbJ (UPF0337 family)
MFNEEQLKGKWKEFKGGVRNLWGKVTEDEIDQTQGSFTKLSGIIQSKYGESKESITQKLDKLKDSFDNETDKADHDISSSSYQRNPTAEPTVDSDFSGDERNFSLGRNFNSGSATFQDSAYDSDDIYDENTSQYSERGRGNLTGLERDSENRAGQ